MCSLGFDATYRRAAENAIPDLQKIREDLWKKYDEYAAKYGGIITPFEWAFAEFLLEKKYISPQ